MPVKIKTTYKTTGFDEFQKNIKNSGKKHLKLGVFTEKAARIGSESSSVNNPTLAAIQELGSISRRIPARSFLKMPIIQKKNDLSMALFKILQSNLIKENGIAMGLKRFGLECENVIQEAFETRGYGKWKPNIPSTIKQKGSDSPLIDTGALRKSIKSKLD